MARMASGRLFQRRGAALENAFSPSGMDEVGMFMVEPGQEDEERLKEVDHIKKVLKADGYKPLMFNITQL